MGESYEFTFQKVSRLWGITTQRLVDDQVITEREAKLIDKGQVTAARLSTLFFFCGDFGGPLVFFFVENLSRHYY